MLKRLVCGVVLGACGASAATVPSTLPRPDGKPADMTAIWFYPLTKKRCMEIRHEIDAKSSSHSSEQGAG